MKMDPRQLRVAEAVRLLNSTPLGEVVQPHMVYRHLNRVAYRIGDGRRIDLVRYSSMNKRRQICFSFVARTKEASPYAR